MLTPREIPSTRKILLRGGSNPWYCNKQDSKPNTLPTSYSGPQSWVQVILVTWTLVLQWLPCQGPGVAGSTLRLAGPVSVWLPCQGPGVAGSTLRLAGPVSVWLPCQGPGVAGSTLRLAGPVSVWLPCQGPGVAGSTLRLADPVSVYCDWWDSKSDLQLLSLCGSTYHYLSRPVLETLWMLLRCEVTKKQNIKTTFALCTSAVLT